MDGHLLDTTDAESMNHIAMVEQLTAKNLDLEDLNKKLESTVEDLKSLNQYNEEIINELETGKNEYKSMNEYNEQIIDELTAKNMELEEQIRKLNQTLDELELNNQATDDIITDLTEKNLDFEDRNNKLNTAIAEYESINQCNEEIIESMREMEKEMNQKLERELVTNSILSQQIMEWEKRAEDSDRIIQKFRQKITELNEKVEEQKDEIAGFHATEEKRLNATSDGGSFSLLSMNINRTFADMVEADHRAVEHESDRQYIGYLKMFLPDNFTKPGSDNDCVLLCTFFPRLSAKAVLLIKLLNLKFPIPQGGVRREHITNAHKAEQWAHIKCWSYWLNVLGAISQKFVSVLKHCSVDRLSRLSVQQLEILSQEKHLDQFFDLIRTNRFGENTSVERIERIINFLQKQLTNLHTNDFNRRDDLLNSINQIKDAILWIQFNCLRLNFFLKPSSDASIIGEFAQTVNTLSANLGECDSLAIRALNRLPKDNELLIPNEVYERLQNAICTLEKFAKIIDQVGSLATSQLESDRQADADSDGLQSQQMNEFLLSSIEKFLGTMETRQNPKDVLREFTDVVRSFLLDISDRLENSSMEIPPVDKQGFPPLLDRAHARKNEVVETEGLRWQVSKKDEEIMKLQKVLKQRDGDISTMKLRLEMADVQLTKSTDKSNDMQVGRLQSRNDELQEDMQKQKREYECTIEQLQKSLEQSERDREKEQARTREFSKRALFANMTQNMAASGHTQPPAVTPLFGASNSVVGDSTPGSHLEDYVKGVERSLQIVYSDLEWSKRRIRKLEAENSRQVLKQLPELELPDIVCGINTLRLQSKPTAQQLELQRMLRESQSLIEELNHNLIEPYDKHRREAYRRNVASINFRAERLVIQYEKFWATNYPGRPVPSLLTPELLADSQKKEKSTDKTCASILEKWGREIDEKENWYREAVRRRQSSFDKQEQRVDAAKAM